MSAARKPRGKSATFDINRVLSRIQEGKGTLADCGAAAEYLDVPAWVLLVPGIARRDMRAIVAIAEAYTQGYADGAGKTRQAAAA